MYSHRQLYDFAHRALPQILFSRPADFFMVLSGVHAAEFLHDVWQLVNEALEKEGAPFDPAPHSWKTTTARIGDYPAVLIEMPIPSATTECHYLAVVLMLNLTVEPRPDPKTLGLRYITLEFNEDAPAATMLCGWQYDQAGAHHQNFGAGPAPGDLKKFAEAVKELLAPA